MKLMLQIGVVFAICFFGQALSVVLPIAVPGSVLSMLALFLLLAAKILRVDHLRQKSSFLLSNMAFFFIPAGVGIIAEYPSIKDKLLPLTAVVVLTTVITFGATAMTVQGVVFLQDRIRKAFSGKKGRTHE